MRTGWLPAATVALLLLAASPVAAAQEDPWTLRFNPFRRGFEGWTRTGPDKAFAWTDAEALLTVKGPSGKEPPRLVHSRTVWDRGAVRFEVKKGSRRLRLLLVPEKGGAPVGLEVPRDGLGNVAWSPLVMRFGDGKASLLVPGGDGKDGAAEPEKTVATAEIPSDGKFRLGFEAPSGADGAVTAVRFERVQEDAPQFHEPDFEPVFDGTNLAPWVPGQPESASVFRVERGALVGEVRVEDYGWLVLADRRYKAYELRMNALWSSNSLEVRAVEVPGARGEINKFETVSINFTDHLDPESMNEISIRVAEGTLVAVANGKKILETKVKEFAPTPISWFIARGKRCILRDIRVKDLAPDATERSGGPAPAPEAPPPEEKPAADTPWEAKGGFTERDGTWSVEDAGAEAGIVKGGSPAGYELRFKVGKGAANLVVLPRALKGVARSPGIRLEDSLFATAEWTEVVVRVRLLSARVLVAGNEVGALDLDAARGAPGLRVDAGGRARVKDLVLQPSR